MFVGGAVSPCATDACITPFTIAPISACANTWGGVVVVRIIYYGELRLQTLKSRSTIKVSPVSYNWSKQQLINANQLD